MERYDDQAAGVSSHYSKQAPAALRDLLSPAVHNGFIYPPSPGTVSISQPPLSPWSSRSHFLHSSDAVSAQLKHVRQRPAMSPMSEILSPPSMDTVVGGALAPVHENLPSPPASKTGHGLRLPSFGMLGIASPHPDHVARLLHHITGPPLPSHRGNTSFGDAASTEAEMTRRMDEVHLGAQQLDGEKDLNSPRACLKTTQCHLQQYVATAEAGAMGRDPLANVNMMPMDSPQTDSGKAGAIAQGAYPPGTGAGADVITQHITIGTGEQSESHSWVADAIEATLENMRTASQVSNPIKVLSHALPSPSSDGHVFPDFINALHQARPGSPTQWINVFHAVPGRFNFEDIPKSPPNTPGQPIGGDDYFTSKVFDSAVTVSDYQNDLTSLPHSPCPVVPPSSIDVSVVERYIPPTSPNEFIEMFDPNGHSILTDRMVELSPNNGSLVFIYPTKRGGETFSKQYLSPILDPLLRSIVIVNGLSMNLSMQLGTLKAVEHLISHGTLERRIATLCSRLSQASYMQRFHGKRAEFELVYSSKKEVRLSRKTWAEDWWTKQEKVKVRAEVDKEVRHAKERVNSLYTGKPPVEMVQELLEGIASRQRYIEEPQDGIEVSVFVVMRVK